MGTITDTGKGGKIKFAAFLPPIIGKSVIKSYTYILKGRKDKNAVNGAAIGVEGYSRKLYKELFCIGESVLDNQKLSKISWKQFHKSVCSRQKQEFRAAVGNLIQNIDALGGGCLDSRHRNRHY